MRSWAFALITVGALPIMLLGLVSFAVGDERSPDVMGGLLGDLSPGSGLVLILSVAAVVTGVGMIVTDVLTSKRLEEEAAKRDRQEAEAKGITDPEFLASRKRLRDLRRQRRWES